LFGQIDEEVPAVRGGGERGDGEGGVGL
jgi:hypothetical protein